MNDRPPGRPGDRIRLTELSGALPETDRSAAPRSGPATGWGWRRCPGAVDPDAPGGGSRGVCAGSASSRCRRQPRRPRRVCSPATTTARLAAFHDLVADPGLRAVIFARGGHGVLRLLPRIDWEAAGAAAAGLRRLLGPDAVSARGGSPAGPRRLPRADGGGGSGARARRGRRATRCSGRWRGSCRRRCRCAARKRVEGCRGRLVGGCLSLLVGHPRHAASRRRSTARCCSGRTSTSRSTGSIGC